VKQHASFNYVSQFRKLSQLLVKKPPTCGLYSGTQLTEISWRHDIQDTIFHSINFTAMNDTVDSDIMAAVGNWKLTVNLQEPCLAKYNNRGAGGSPGGYCRCDDCDGMLFGFAG
jgi:hypothetical protein